MIKLIGMIIAALGVVCIYDARPLAKKHFDEFGEENDITTGLKMIGCLMSIIGGLIVIFNL